MGHKGCSHTVREVQTTNYQLNIIVSEEII